MIAPPGKGGRGQGGAVSQARLQLRQQPVLFATFIRSISYVPRGEKNKAPSTGIYSSYYSCNTET